MLRRLGVRNRAAASFRVLWVNGSRADVRKLVRREIQPGADSQDLE